MSAFIALTDAADPRAAAFQDVRERDLVGRQGRFIIEGEVVLRLAIGRSRFAIETVLIAENRVAALADCLAALPLDVPVLVAPGPVMSAIAGFPLHRGVLAAGLRGPEPEAGDLVAGLSDKALVLVLSGIANHDNVGGLFRNAAAFGVDAVLLDGDSCDPLYRKAIRVSAGAALVTPFSRGGTLAALTQVLAQRGFTIFATSPSGREALFDVAPSDKTAVVMGPEGAGLPQSYLDKARTIRIAMAAGFDSLNVATAAGIVLHHFARLRPPLLKTSSTRPTERNR